MLVVAQHRQWQLEASNSVLLNWEDAQVSLSQKRACIPLTTSRSTPVPPDGASSAPAPPSAAAALPGTNPRTDVMRRFGSPAPPAEAPHSQHPCRQDRQDRTGPDRATQLRTAPRPPPPPAQLPLPPARHLYSAPTRPRTAQRLRGGAEPVLGRAAPVRWWKVILKWQSKSVNLQ